MQRPYLGRLEAISDARAYFGVAGVALMFLRASLGHLLSTPFLELVVLPRLTMELYPPALENWKPGRKTEVAREIKLVRRALRLTPRHIAS